MANAVVISELEMQEVLDSGKRLPTYAREGGQLVATWELSSRKLLVKVYTSCFGGWSRPTGEDSIRVALVDPSRGRGVGRTAWTCRTEGWPERLKAKIREMFLLAKSLPLCPRCDALMAQRKGPRGVFWGCTAYPDCRGTREVNHENPSTKGQDRGEAAKESAYDCSPPA